MNLVKIFDRYLFLRTIKRYLINDVLNIDWFLLQNYKII